MRGPMERMLDASREEGTATIDEEITTGNYRESDQMAKIGLLTGTMCTFTTGISAVYFVHELDDTIAPEDHDSFLAQALDTGIEVAGYVLNKGFGVISVASAIFAVEGFNFCRRARKRHKQLMREASSE